MNKNDNNSSISSCGCEPEPICSNTEITCPECDCSEGTDHFTKTKIKPIDGSKDNSKGYISNEEQPAKDNSYGYISNEEQPALFSFSGTPVTPKDMPCADCGTGSKPTSNITKPGYENGNPVGDISPIDLGVEPDIVTKIFVDRDGVFDDYMNAGYQQTKRHYEEGRLKGADFTQAHLQMTQLMMQQANGYVLQKYQVDAQIAQMEVQLGLEKEKVRYEISLMIEQIRSAKYNNELLREKVKTERLQHQLLITQEEEERANGRSQRALAHAQGELTTNQSVKTSTETSEMLKNGHAQRNLVLAQNKQATTQTKKIATDIEEMTKNGHVQRGLILAQNRQAVTQSKKIATETTEMTKNGKAQRDLIAAQNKQATNQSALIATQASELTLNGKSKRALEDGQRKVTAAQCALYAAQSKGFADKNRNDTFKTVMNAWAVSVSELENPGTPMSLTGDKGAAIDQTLMSAKSQANLA